MHELMMSGRALTLLGLLLLTTLLPSCAAQGASETERTICRELRRDLPTYSTRDTAETLQSGAQFIRTFNAICED
ncbi:hypothetical protein [Paenirhodobacter sp.]|uniref:hypothetical protein n=1 Tax=Paenirhodobacter sp. TaxID=1965326 RepID=UPI003B5066A5